MAGADDEDVKIVSERVHGDEYGVISEALTAL
jgi:hypothetical protein